MRRIYYLIRTVLVWILSVIHFFPICSALVFMGIFVDPRRNDRPQRWFFRNILRVAGVRFEVRCAPGFDQSRTSFFVCNHVNLFDAFVIYSAIPQFVRGLEQESHFRIPAYGWMMKRFGNIPVAMSGGTAAYKQMVKETKAAIQRGVSLIVFAEGTRTLTGRVAPFKPGVFRMAQQFACPIVPMSIVGSYEFSRKGSWMLYPSKIVVYLHDTIETSSLTRNEIEPLADRVHQIVSAPVDAYYEAGMRHPKASLTTP
ncbi:MAG: lysophospholipid acyltransferase family protein [Acidobacteriota bacterium]